MALADTLLAIERPLWTNNAEIYEASLVEHAVLIFPETGPIDRAFAVSAIREENAEGRRWEDVTFDDVRAVELTDGAALLYYTVTARWEGDVEPIVALASSVYVKRGDGWKLAFHQQTPRR